MLVVLKNENNIFYLSRSDISYMRQIRESNINGVDIYLKYSNEVLRVPEITMNEMHNKLMSGKLEEIRSNFYFKYAEEKRHVR